MKNQKDERILPLKSIERLMKKLETERISKNAVILLEKILCEIGLKISILAKELAIHSKRKTIKERDIELAYRQISKLNEINYLDLFNSV